MARRPLTPVVAAASTDEMVDAIAAFYDDPLGYVHFAYPWGEEGTELHDETGPDVWQTEFLTNLGNAVRERMMDNVQLGAILMGAATGHGTGKSALVAWVIDWFMSTRPDANIVVTANTAAQLSGKTWRELAKWTRLAINSSWFHWTATRLVFKARPETWIANAVPWTKENSEAFAGTHARHVLMIFDEASGIDDAIWEVGEGAMTTPGAMWLVFGNTTRNKGRFRECFRQFRHRWLMQKVDSRTAKKANRKQIQQWIDDYGEDSDFVRIRVRGEFPRASSTQLIGGDLVEEAKKAFRMRFGDTLKVRMREGPGCFERFDIDDNPLAPKIITLDVARFGGDQSVLGMRQGKTFIALAKWRELDTMQLAARVAEWLNAEQPDVFIADEVGVGGGVVDVLRNLGHEVEGCNAGVKAIEERKFFNRRAEMWWSTREWLAKGGRIDHEDSELADDLTAPEYAYSDRGEKVQLETKEDMRARGLPSPDTGDCLAMSFWMPVAFKNEAATVAAKIARAARLQRAGGGGEGSVSWMSF
jgi:hypothetical protein